MSKSTKSVSNTVVSTADKGHLAAHRAGECYWQQPVEYSDSEANKSLKKDVTKAANAQLRDYIKSQPITDAVDIHESAHADNWTVGMFQDVFEIAEGKVKQSKQRTAPLGAMVPAELLGGSNGKDADDLTLNGFNRQDWKLKYNELARILNPDAEADKDNLRECLTAEVAPRLAYLMNHCDSVGGRTSAGFQHGIAAAVAESYTVTPQEIVAEQMEMEIRKNPNPIKSRNKKLVSPAQLELLVRKSPAALEDERVVARRTLGKQLGLSGEHLEGFVAERYTANGEWNLQPMYLKGEMSLRTALVIDLIEINSIETQVRKLEAYKAHQSFLGNSVEELQSMIDALKTEKGAKLDANLSKACAIACRRVNDYYVKHAAQFDSPLPDDVEQFYMLKVVNGFQRKMTKFEKLSEDLLYGTNNSGENNGRQVDVNLSVYYSNRREYVKTAENFVAGRYLNIKAIQELAGNLGMMNFDQYQVEAMDESDIDY